MQPFSCQLREQHISKRSYEISVVQEIHIFRLELQRWSCEDWKIMWTQRELEQELFISKDNWSIFDPKGLGDFSSYSSSIFSHSGSIIVKHMIE